jgi:hypothetical protein
MPPRSSDKAQTHLQVRRLVLYCDPPLVSDDGLLRKAVTAQLPDRELLHGHDPEGRPIASYVRYRIEEGRGQLIGWGPGLNVLEQVRDELTHLRLGHSMHEVLGTELHDNVEPFGRAEYPLRYCSVSPWLALNEKNHARYSQLKDFEMKRELLSGVMVGNLLSLAKNADHWVNGRIICDVSAFQEQPVMHKETELLGFVVECHMNFHLPQWLGIGKLTSKGYGLLRAEEDDY